MDESMLSAHEARITSLEREFAEIRDDVRLTREVAQRLEVQFAGQVSRPQCAAPSTCMTLVPRISDLEVRLRNIESEKDKMTGGAKAAFYMVGLWGGALGILVTFAIQYIIKHL